MSNTKPMRRKVYSKKQLELPPLCAWDIETEGLGGKFIIAAFVTSDGERELCYSLSDCFYWMANHPGYRYLAHNASGYEFCYLYPFVYDFFMCTPGIEIEPCLQGDTNIIQIRIKKDGEDWLDLRDTYCLFNMKLEKVADAFCSHLPKLKGNIDFERDIFDPANKDHIAYVFRDCDILIAAYTKLASDISECFGSPLGITAGATAIRSFYTTIPLGHCYYRLKEPVDEFVRKCYYGGLVLPGKEVGNWGAIASVDVNGAYAFQMVSHLYPVGTPYSCRRYIAGRIGFYHVIATVPESVFDTVGFNPVPKREKEGLCWPSGTFETYISSVEYDYAVSCGCTFRVLWGYLWTRLEPVFEAFIRKCQELELANNGEKKQSIKIERNAFYGKLGSKPEHSKLFFSHDTQPYEPLTNETNGSIIEGLYLIKEESSSDYMLPHWAALTTAYQRVYLMRIIQECYRRGAKNVYCDTDSIKCDVSILLNMVKDGSIPTGKRYGDFKVEEICYEFILVGPKCFLGRVALDTSNAQIMKAKGIPTRVIKKKSRVYKHAIENKRRAISFQSTEKLMNIIKKQKLMQPIKRKRTITDLLNSFSWQLTPDNKIFPRGYRI